MKKKTKDKYPFLTDLDNLLKDMGYYDLSTEKKVEIEKKMMAFFDKAEAVKWPKK